MELGREGDRGGSLPAVPSPAVDHPRLTPLPRAQTAITLRDRSTWLLASHALDPNTLTTLTSLPGPVKYIVSPDKEHTMYLSHYASAFPDAKLYVPSSVKEAWKVKGSGKEEMVKRVAFTFGEGGGDPFEGETQGEMKCADFGKAFVNEVSFGGGGAWVKWREGQHQGRRADFRVWLLRKDVAFFHEPTKTLIEADLLFNLPPTEQVSSGFSLRTKVGVHERRKEG
jgi:hypothetical protein